METNSTNSNLSSRGMLPTNKPLNPKAIVSLCLSKWRWFIASIACVVGIALLYILCTPPVYICSASLLVKESNNGQSASGNVSSMFAEMGLSNTNTNVNNELKIIQSPIILTETVKRLNLEVDYFTRGLFHDKTVYGSELPVKVVFSELDDNAAFSVKLHLSEDGIVQFSDLECGDNDLAANTFEGKLNDTLSIGIGKAVVLPTMHYKAGNNYPILHIHRSGIHGTMEKCKMNFSAILSSDATTVIDLFYQDVSIQRAKDILNTIITVYNENWLKDKNQITVSTSQFINERLGVIERELGDVDEDISSFKSTHLLPDVNAASSLYMSQSQATSNQLLELNTRLSMAHQVRNYVVSNAGKDQLLPANSGLESPGIERQIAEYNDTQLQRNNLVSNSSEQNPLVLDMDQSLETMRRAILSSIDNLIATLNTQIASLRHNEQQTTAQIAANPDQTKYLQAVGRQQKVKEELYLFLLQKREENELSQAFTAYNTRLITPPNGSFTPVAPKKKNILFMAFIIGMVIPAVIIIMRESMNSAVKDRKDLANLSIPFLGEIPLCLNLSKKEKRIKPSSMSFWANKSKLEAKTIVVKEGKRDMTNEAFRVLRTNLEFINNKDKKTNVHVITSFNPGSGKTFITMNLAVSFAIKGKKVLVIDGDLRHASTSSYVNSPKSGLSDYLAGRVDDIRTVLVAGTKLAENNTDKTCSPYENLTVLPVGTIPPNPTELLFDDRFEKLILEMRDQYDYVFIDCPPIDIMADTQIIEKLADRTIFIVRAGLLERSMLPELEQIYRERRFKDMSMILNGVEGTGRYGYKYGYKYGYVNYGEES